MAYLSHFYNTYAQLYLRVKIFILFFILIHPNLKLHRQKCSGGDPEGVDDNRRNAPLTFEPG